MIGQISARTSSEPASNQLAQWNLTFIETEGLPKVTGSHIHC